MYEILYLESAKTDLIRIGDDKKADLVTILAEIPRKLGHDPVPEKGARSVEGVGVKGSKKELSTELPASLKSLISAEFGDLPAIGNPWNVHLARDRYRAVYVVQDVADLVTDPGQLDVDGIVSIVRIFLKPLTEEFNRALERWDESMPRKLMKEKSAVSSYISWQRLLRKMARQANDDIAAGNFHTHDEIVAFFAKRYKRPNVSRR